MWIRSLIYSYMYSLCFANNLIVTSNRTSSPHATLNFTKFFGNVCQLVTFYSRNGTLFPHPYMVGVAFESVAMSPFGVDIMRQSVTISQRPNVFANKSACYSRMIRPKSHGKKPSLACAYTSNKEARDLQIRIYRI